MKLLILLFAALPLIAQTVVGPRVYPNGTSDPATCVVGQYFMRTDTQTVKICTSTNTWTAISGSGGGTTNPLQTLANLVTRTSSTVLTLLPSASASTPYGFTVYGGTSDTTYNFTTNPTGTISAGTGTAYIYVDIGGTLSIGHNGLTVSCAGACAAVSGITQFPKSSIHIATWTATSGTWDTSGGTNFLGVGASVNTASLSGGGGGPTCTGFTVPYTSLTAASHTQEITIQSSVAAATAFGAAYFSQDTNFSGGSGTTLTVSMGRTGSNNTEMSGGQVPLMSGGISTPYSFAPPSPLQVSSTYNIVLAFTSDVNLNTYTAGSLSGSLCSYAF